MLLRRLIAVIVIAGMLASPPVSHVSAATPCNWAQFIADVSIPDGTVLAPGTVFTKTWRLQNSGTCTWTTAYSLAFDSGSQMSGPAGVNLSAAVAPGSNADLSVMLTAPAAAGHYRGFWKLKDGSGTTFGIGSTANGAFWVDIEVQDTAAVVYDLVTYAPYAQWSSGAGALPFPGTSGDYRGYAQRLDSVTMEDGAFTTRPSLLTVPQSRFDGYIQAIYPEFTVQQGDRFQAAVGCEAGASCYVRYQLNYVTAAGSTRSFWTRNEMNDGRVYQASVDLSSLAGQTVRFELAILALGSPSGDRAIWGAPRIVRTNLPPNPPTAVPPPTFTPSATPLGGPPPIVPSGCDKAAFVADINVPDGTLFAPGAAFSKTWRMQNTGSCAWTTSYRLLFYTGAQMNGPTSLNLPRTVNPGETIDLTVNLAAPPANGEYIGYWVLSNPNGALFGIGPNATMPFWVRINVSGQGGLENGYDFAANVCAAQWRSGAGALPCPGTDGNAAGFVIKQDAPHLEDGSASTLPGLLTMPQNKFDGYIQGIYPTFTVQPGDRFQTTAGCEYQAQCYVTFRLDYMSPNGEIHNFYTRREQNEAQQHYVDVDLSLLAGQSVRFVLTVLATGSPANDRSIWGAPHILRPPSPLTQTITPTFTSSPTPVTTDWLTYVNAKYGFQFKYPKESQIVSQNDNYAKIQLPIVPGTNLREKYLEIVVAENATTCRSPLGLGGVQTSETVVINGITFLKESADEGAAGNHYQWVGYATMRGTTCISMSFVLHSLDPTAWPTPVPAFDKALESAVFGQIMNTFAFLTATDTPTPTSTPVGGEWLTYTNTKYGFRLNYPPQGQITTQTDNDAKITLPFTAGTNLRDKDLEIKVTENLSPCRTSLSGIVTASETVVINGISFLKETGMDGAAGNLYDWVAYSTARDTTCISLGFVLHSLDPGALPTPVVVYDKDAESAVFGQIMNTFTWLTPTETPTPTPTFTATPTPPTGGWLTYTNPRYGFELKYPKEGVVSGQLDNFAHISLPFAPGTNLVDKYLEVYIAENVDPCQSPLATTSMLNTTETVVINGITYLKQTGGDAATSQIYQWVAYSTVRGAACVSLNFVLHSINPGVYPTPPVLFDDAAERAVFEQIVATFTWLTPTDTPTPSPTPTSTALPGPLPDLTVVGMMLGYQNGGCILPTDQYGLWVRVSNIGTAAAPAFMVQAGDSQESVAGLGAGETATVRLSSTFMGGQITAVADSASQVAESDETNNSLTQYVPIPTQPLPCTATPTAAALIGPYAVILVNYGGTLNVYSDAGTSNLVTGSFTRDAINIMRTGPSKFAEGSEWYEVLRTDGGTGWVDSRYLTEYVTGAAFCADGRISGMIGQIKQAMDSGDGSLFASVVSPMHGAAIGYWRSGTAVNYTAATAEGIFKDPTVINWGAGPSVIEDIGTFADIVQPDLVDVLGSSYQTFCDNPSYASMFPNAWGYQNIHYYSVVKPPTSTFDWKVWLFGFEYVDGRPFLFGTVHYVWEP